MEERMNEPQPNQTIVFLEHHTKNWTKNELVEIRLTPVRNKETYTIINQFFKTYNIYCNSKKSLFFKRDELQYIPFLLKELEEKKCVEKICYSIHSRVYDKNTTTIETSGLKNIPFLDTIMLDIECVKKPENEEELKEQKKSLFIFVEHLLKLINIDFALRNPTIIDSGRGIHLLFKIPRLKYTDSRKEAYRATLERIQQTYSNEYIVLDGAVKDASRVFGLPGSINPRWNRRVELLELGKYPEYNKYKLHTPKKNVPRRSDIGQYKFKTQKGSVYDTLSWVIFENFPPEGETNNTVVFSILLWVKDFGVETTEELERAAYRVWGEKWVMRVESLNNQMYWHPKLIYNFCKRHRDWVKQKKEVYTKFKEFCEEFELNEKI